MHGQICELSFREQPVSFGDGDELAAQLAEEDQQIPQDTQETAEKRETIKVNNVFLDESDEFSVSKIHRADDFGDDSTSSRFKIAKYFRK